MAVHTSTTNTGICLARGFQKHLSDPTWVYILLDQGEVKKCASKWTWTYLKYHVQERKYDRHISVKMS